MRVCLVSREVRPFDGGGIATYVAEMSRALVAEGHEVHVLTARRERLTERAATALPGVALHEVDVSRGPAALPGTYYTEANRYAMAVYTTLADLHDRVRFDYVEFPEYRGEGYWALRAKRTLGKFAEAVLGVRLHTPHYLCREVDRTAVCDVECAHIRHMELWSVKECDLLLSASAAAMERVVADCDGSLGSMDTPRRIVRLPLDFEELAQGTGGPEEGGEPIILSVGRLQVCKGAQDLVAAGLALCERGLAVRFRFIGEDTLTGPFGRSMRDHLEKIVKGTAGGRYAPRFEFLPPRPREQLGAAIRGATVCCFASLWDSYSYACVEAMALGACVVASDAGALKEIVEDGKNGLSYRSEHVTALASALERVLADGGLRRELASGARQRARELSDAQACVRRLVDCVTEVRPQATAERPLGPAPKRDAPDVTVVIPHYNLAQTLPETLESLKRQTMRAFELIVVDDGSTDPMSVAYLSEIERQGVRVVRKTNGGLGSARNVGFREARGQFVAPLDADDLLHPEYLEKLYGAIRRDESLASVSCMVQSFYAKPDEVASGYAPLAIDPDLLLYHNVGGPGAGSILVRDVVLSLGGYDEWLTSFEDWDLWCVLAENGYHGKVIPEFLLYYRLRPDSLLRTEASQRWHALQAYIIAKHARLGTRPDVALRMQLAETYELKDRVATLERDVAGLTMRLGELMNGDAAVQAAAERMVQGHLRYRFADRINDILKSAGLQKAVKRGIEAVRRSESTKG